MKRILAFFLILSLWLTGCGKTPVSPSPSFDPGPVSAGELLEQLLAVVPEDASASSAEENAASLLIYGIDPALVTDCAVARLGGARVFELAVIDLNGSSGAAAEALLDYLVQRQGGFTGYAPEQADLASAGKLFASADTLRLVLVITEGIREVTDILNSTGYLPVFRAYDLTGSILPTSPAPAPSPSAEPTPEPTPEPSVAPSTQLPRGWTTYTPPNTDDMSIYDTSAILTAWAAGSPDGLGRKDKWVYERCAELIGQLISEAMSEYEKEWAIYSWLINHVEYDYRHQDPSQTTPRDSFRPYGALVNGTAVCLGYATTFQLFMDLLGIDCITVVGAAFNSSADHAWNMVRLNGEWYCVDATWDLNHGRSPQRCLYFNVTSEHMAKSDHQWDYENIPMATATDGGNP